MLSADPRSKPDACTSTGGWIQARNKRSYGAPGIFLDGGRFASNSAGIEKFASDGRAVHRHVPIAVGFWSTFVARITTNPARDPARQASRTPCDRSIEPRS